MRFFLLAACAAFVLGQEKADPVVITVGPEKITKSQFEQIVGSLPERQREELKDPAARKKIAGQLAELMTLAQEGPARKLDQTAKMRIQMDKVIATAWYQELAA